MSGNKFGITCLFKKLQIGATSIVWDVQEFGTTLGTMVELTASGSDVGATMKEIRTQANQQMKLVKKLAQVKIHPIDVKAPHMFFGMAWYPNASQKKWFPEIKTQQGKKSAGDDSWIKLWTEAPNQESMLMTGVMVLHVGNDPRNGNQLVQFEFDKVKDPK